MKYKDENNRINKLAIANILMFIVMLIIINQIITQYVAYHFNYNSALGKAVIGHKIYLFYDWIIWIIKFRHTQSSFFLDVAWVFSILFIATIFIFFLVRMFISRKAQAYDDVHGSAKWADKKDIDKMDLLNTQEGVYIGAWQDPKSSSIKYLKHNGPEHILAFAPTRSGKGVGLVIPTLLAWKGSCVVLDIKGENWELTAGCRQSIGQKVLRFDPVSQSGGVGYNPLEEIRLNSIYTVSDVQNIASIIIDPDGKGLDDHWAKTGYALLTTMILHLIYKAQKEGFTPSLSDLRGLINDPTKDSVKDTLNEWIEYEHYVDDNGNWITDYVVAVGAKEAANKDERELSSIVSTVVSNLSLYDDPVLKSNINKSGFKIADLMRYDDPVSLYLVIKPSDMNRIRPLTRIILNQILTLLVGDMKFKDGQQVIEYKHRLLLMLDEFTSLGKLPLFETALAYMAGYGIKAYIIIQDLTQLYKAYSKDEAVISNSHVRIAYAPNKVETAELLSKMAGQTTVVKTVRTASGHRASILLGNVSENYQEVQRPLLTIDECMQLPGAQKDSAGKVTKPGDMLIFVAGNPTIYGKQILYFMDPVFSKRSKMKSPEISDSLILKDVIINKNEKE